MNIIKGDLIKLAKEKKFDIIVQGCNCFNTMNSGLAKQIREQFPTAYEEDCKTLKGDKNKLGSYTVSRICHWAPDWANIDSRGYVDFKLSVFYIVNAYTQYNYGRDRQQFNVNAFITFLYSFDNYIKLMYESNHRKNETGRFNDDKKILEIGFPKIGCGLGGGDWNQVRTILRDFSHKVESYANITLVEL